MSPNSGPPAPTAVARAAIPGIGVGAVARPLLPRVAGGVDLAAVVPGPLVRVGQQVVGGADVLERGLGGLVAGVQVGVVLSWRACGTPCGCRPPTRPWPRRGFGRDRSWPYHMASAARRINRFGTRGTNTAAARPSLRPAPGCRRCGTARRRGERRSCAQSLRIRRPTTGLPGGRSFGRVVMMAPSRTPSRSRARVSRHSASHCGRVRSRPGLCGSMPGAEQQLRAVDVADAGDHVLVHQQLADGGAGGVDRLPRLAGPRAGRSGSGPSLASAAAFSGAESSSQAVGPLRSAMWVAVASRSRTAPRGTGAPSSPSSPPPSTAADPVQPGPGEPPHAVQAQMDAQPDRPGEADEHLLAPGLRLLQHQPVQRGRAIGEPALRAAGAGRVAGELRVEGVGEAVDGVAFGRGGLLTRGVCQVCAVAAAFGHCCAGHGVAPPAGAGSLPCTGRLAQR